MTTIKSNYLRISVTDKCNLSCYYCHREGQINLSNYCLTSDDIRFIISQSMNLGFSKIKLTGGEPLIRKDIVSVIENINNLQIPDLSIITNGVLLSKYVSDLKNAGLQRLNVSLHTLNKTTFENTIDKDSQKLDLIIKGIDKAINIGYKNMKLNFIYHSKTSDKDFEDICKFASERDLTIFYCHYY